MFMILWLLVWALSACPNIITNPNWLVGLIVCLWLSTD